jgi:predicted metal-binding membrane protein
MLLTTMNRVQKAVVISLIATSAIAWIASIDQPDMMVAMTTYNPLSISLFTASWTAGMAAMMFPAITPMVLMYNRLVTNMENNRDSQSSVTIQEEERGKASSSFPSLKVIVFVGCYLLVWAATGIALLLGWSVVMNSTIMTTTGNTVIIQYLYGALLIIAGAYQFTPLKRICIGYCESPMSFFMRRWRDGTLGAVNMGVYHGLYCLGCCWAYFLLMVALGWMNLLWMGLFAGIIFGEKMWSRGIWVARAAGIGLTVIGILVAAGMLPSLVSSATSMTAEDDRGDDMTMMMDDDNNVNNNVKNNNDDNKNNNNSNGMTMSNYSPEPSMEMSDDSVASSGANDQSHEMASDRDGETMESMDNDNGNGPAETIDME